MKTNYFDRKCLFTSTIAVFANLVLFAQVDVKWKKDLSSPIHWQEVTSLGNLIVSSGNQLAGVDTESGSINWSKIDLAGISRDAYKKIPNSPFFTIAKGNSILLIDEFSGALAFDSEKAGVKTIEDYFFLYRADAILVAGTSFSGDPIMVSVRMSSGQVSWSMNEKFGRIVTATELNDQELLIVTLFNNYKINAISGKIIWKEVNSSEAAQLDKMGAFGALMKSAAENHTKDMEIELRYFRPEGSEVFYIGSQKESQSGITSSTGSSQLSITRMSIMPIASATVV
ncbi:MAG: hypothetical protein U5K79_12835 [Cyclobacteriaceae bacterium]|nr:hypothetical protein [Cyclobacteriaceae bacterium]